MPRKREKKTKAAGQDDEGSENVPYARAVAELAPQPEFEESVQEALTAVQEAVKQVFGDEAWVLPFGSLVQGVPLKGSDLDLCMEVPGVVAGVAGNGKADNSQQVTALRRLMKKLPNSFRVVETRFFKHIKVPIIILEYVSSAGLKVETDISVGVTFEGVEKGFTDRLVRRVLACTPRALHAVRLIKVWAKVENLNKAYEGFLNSLGWTLLVVYFFMARGEVIPDSLDMEEATERGLDDGATLPLPLYAGTDDDVPSGEEIAEFFDMVASFDEWPVSDASAAWGISLVDRGDDDESSQHIGMYKMSSMPPIKKQWSDQIDVFLEDPGIKMAVGRSENVARALKKGPWLTTLNKAREAATSLRADSTSAADDWVADLITRAEADAAAKAAPPVVASRKRPLQAPAAQPAWDAKRQKGNAWQQQDNWPIRPGMQANWQQMAQQIANTWSAQPTWRGGNGAGGGGRRGGGNGGGGWAFKA